MRYQKARVALAVTTSFLLLVLAGSGGGLAYAHEEDEEEEEQGNGQAGGGDITAVNAGFGLTGGGTSGSVTLNVDPNQVQRRVTGTCPAGQAMQTIDVNGNVTCEVDDVGVGGGTVTQLNQGAGITLTPNPITGSGTISVATDGISSAMIQAGAVTSAKIEAGAVSGGVGGTIADGTITAADLAPNSVESDELADNSVTSSKIAPGTITAADVNPGEIQTRVTPPTCPVGEVLQTINATGAPVCVALPSGGGGTVTSVTAVAPLSATPNPITNSGTIALPHVIINAAEPFNTGIGFQALQSNTPGLHNTATGAGALQSNTTIAGNPGENNTATGAGALLSNRTGDFNTATGSSALASNTTASNNTAVGFQALQLNTTDATVVPPDPGENNTAMGTNALKSNTVGDNNTATGVEALSSNTTGVSNTATGVEALSSNTTGNNNTASGFSALFNNTTGSDNTAIGSNALESNTTGGGNTATGERALQSNTTGGSNTAAGRGALLSNTTGSANTATGSNALESNTIGDSNTAIGFQALQSNIDGRRNTAIGGALANMTTGDDNIAVGDDAGQSLTSGSNNIYVGSPGGGAEEASTIRIGTPGTQTSTFIAGISGVTPAGATMPVVIDNNGQLGTGTAGGVTSVQAGDGLTATPNNPITTTGTISVATNPPGISTAMIQDTAVTAAKIAEGAVSGGVNGKIADGTITAADLANNSVEINELADNSVNGAKIVNESVGLADLALNSVDGSKIVDGSVSAADMDPSQIQISANNTAVGTGSLPDNTGNNNTAIGANALDGNISGTFNTAIGTSALLSNSTDSFNTAIGFNAGENLQSGSNNIYVGNSGAATESGTIRIGSTGTHTSTFIAGIRNTTVGVDNLPVVIDSTGRLGTGPLNIPPFAQLGGLPSSRRFKEDIHDMGEASSGLLRLRPVTFRYKEAFADGARPVQYGLIAEEVAEVDPSLVAYSHTGEVETVQYHKLIPMLLNELQKQGRRLEALQADNAALKARLDALERFVLSKEALAQK